MPGNRDQEQTVNIGGVEYDVSTKELEQILLALLPSDIETASFHSINFTEALTLYGTYELPFITRFGRVQANGVTHYWGDKAIAGGATNQQPDAQTWTSLTPVDTVGDRHSNTCQIMMKAAAVGGSAQAEAQVGAVLGITDLIADQRNDAMEMLLKDMEYGLLNGDEDTSSPREMSGVFDWITNNSGSNVVDNSGAEFSEDALIDWLATIRDQNTGYMADSLYMSGKALRTISSWTEDKVRFVIDLGRMEQLTSLAAGQAAGIYVTPDGHILKLYYHPFIAHSGTAANNYMLAITERLIKMAFLRALRVIRTPNIADAVLDVFLVEFTMQLKVALAHGKLHNFLIS